MKRNGPGKSFRKGLTLMQLLDLFPDDEVSRKWLEKERWPDGVRCPHCGTDDVQHGVTHQNMTHRCRRCPRKPFFCVKTNSVMHGSRLGYRTWGISIYLVAAGIKGTSSMKLHRDLGVTQKTAWYLAHRIRRAFEVPHGPFAGPVEIDETYVGGKPSNMHRASAGSSRNGT